MNDESVQGTAREIFVQRLNDSRNCLQGEFSLKSNSPIKVFEENAVLKTSRYEEGSTSRRKDYNMTYQTGFGKFDEKLTARNNSSDENGANFRRQQDKLNFEQIRKEFRNATRVPNYQIKDSHFSKSPVQSTFQGGHAKTQESMMSNYKSETSFFNSRHYKKMNNCTKQKNP